MADVNNDEFSVEDFDRDLDGGTPVQLVLNLSARRRSAAQLYTVATGSATVRNEGLSATSSQQYSTGHRQPAGANL